MRSPHRPTRKQVEEALKKSEEKFSKAFRQSPLALMLTSAKDNRYIEVNETFEQITGWKRDEVIGRTPYDINIWVDPSQRTAFVKRLLSGGTVRSLDFQFRTRKGEVRAGLGSAELIEIGGEPCVLALAADTTDVKKAEEIRLRHAAIVESSDDAILSKNPEGVISDWNTGAQRMFGYTAEEVIGQPITILIPADLHSEENDILRKLQAGERIEHFQTRRVRKDGKEIDVSITLSPVRDTQGGIVGTSSIARDITESKRAEAALRESEGRFRLAAEAGRMLAYEWDAATDVITRSEGAAHILGAGEGPSTTGQHILSMIPAGDRQRLMAAMAQLTPEQPNLRITYRMIRSDGKVIWVDRTSRAYFDDKGTIVRIVGMIADITDRVRAEEALSKVSQKLIEAQEEERTRIARELHDDVGQRLALLAVHLDGLKKGPPASAAEFGSEIGELHTQVESLANDVQTLSHRLHSPKLEYLGLAAAAASFCRELSNRRGAKIDFRSENIPKETPSGISLCLFRVLQEALQNAIKHSGSRQFQVSLKGGPNEIELTVHDSGIGFEPEEAIKGRGLGLTTMRERLRLVDGQLSIDSNQQRGTTIRARVPLTPGMKSATEFG